MLSRRISPLVGRVAVSRTITMSSPARAVTEVFDKKTFDATLAGKKPVVCDFYAEWCGPCKMISPVLEKMSDSYGDKVEFIKVDVDRVVDVTIQEQIQAMPSFGIYEGGKRTEMVVGADPNRLLTEVKRIAK